MKIAVIGAGVVGLTTAHFLQNEFMRNAEITVFEDFVATSYVAPGIFRIGPSFLGPNEKVVRKWIKYSYEYYDEIRKMNEPLDSGVTDINGYTFANSSLNAVKNHWLEPVVPIYRRATEDECQSICGNWNYGSFFSTLLTECNLYLPWIKQKLQRRGVTFKRQYIQSFNDLVDNFDIIMNCSGLGAKNLCNDNYIVPIRGQVSIVQAPWVKTFIYGEFDTYIIPGIRGTVTLGGTKTYESMNLNTCLFEFASIQKKCRKLLPSLLHAPLMEIKVGLRPHREGGVRIEGANVTSGTAKAIIVHNYGHGGYGVSTAPGTALEAVYLAIQLHKSSDINSKL